MITRYFYRGVSQVATGISLLMAVATAQAHLMVEQHGTVNFANGGAFLVISIPVSAFDGIDDNDDGAISSKELSLHTSQIEQQIHHGVQLLDESGNPMLLQGLLLSLTPPHDAPTHPATQLVALGRFLVDDAMRSPGLRISLHGKASKERQIKITATRDGHSHVMEFTSDRDFHTMFPDEILVE